MNFPCSPGIKPPSSQCRGQVQFRLLQLRVCMLPKKKKKILFATTKTWCSPIQFFLSYLGTGGTLYHGYPYGFHPLPRDCCENACLQTIGSLPDLLSFHFCFAKSLKVRNQWIRPSPFPHLSCANLVHSHSISGSLEYVRDFQSAPWLSSSPRYTQIPSLPLANSTESRASGSCYVASGWLLFW